MMNNNEKWQMLKIDKDLTDTRMYKSVRGLVETEVARQKKVRRVVEAMNKEHSVPDRATGPQFKATPKKRKREAKKGEN